MIIQDNLVIHVTKMDYQMTLSQFQRISYKHQTIGPCFIILEHGEDSPKFAPFFPLIPHISYDGSGSEQVDPLKTLYKRDLTPSTQGTLTYLLSLCSREKTDVIVREFMAGSPQSPTTILFFLLRSLNHRCSPKHLAY